MMENIKANVSDWTDEEEVKAYLIRILRKEANDFSGKIYGIGHAVYTISDPRAGILKAKARELAIEKGRLDEFELYSLVERISPEAFSEFKGDKSNKVLCINVSGWCTHRIEELTFSAKRIIRPAFKNVYGQKEYIALHERD
jgi:citrate synthase